MMHVISVLPDVTGLQQSFDYLSDRPLPVGTVVRVPLGARKVRGWVTANVGNDSGSHELLSVIKVLGAGPPQEVVELCEWVAWRWCGKLVTVMRAATSRWLVPLDGPPPSRRTGMQRRTPPALRGTRPASQMPSAHSSSLAEIAGSVACSDAGTVVMQVPPDADYAEIASGAAVSGQVMMLTPSPAVADRLVRRLHSDGLRVARWPEDWSLAAQGASIVGTRAAVFAPAPHLSSIVVFDEHDALLQNPGSPTWNAREVAVERAKRAAVPCILVSPCPSLEAYRAQRDETLLSVDTPLVPKADVSLSRSATRAGWAPVVVTDRRGEDVGRSGLFSEELVRTLREALTDQRTVTCVVNRMGRARLLACRSCSSIVRCDECDSAMVQPEPSRLRCPACSSERPPVCEECGSGALAVIRPGLSRARGELEALLRVPVDEVTASTVQSGWKPDRSRVAIGTVAVLGQLRSGGVVAFPDFDQELLASRYRASEDALALLMIASRAIGGRHDGALIAVQTRMPDHEVIQAAQHADPTIVAAAEFQRRRLLGLPPVGSVAWIGGEGASEFLANLDPPTGISVLERGDGEWLVTSRVPGQVQDVLGSLPRPSKRLRLQVDPHNLGG